MGSFNIEEKVKYNMCIDGIQPLSQTKRQNM